MKDNIEEKYPRMHITINPSPWDRTERRGVSANEVIDFIRKEAIEECLAELPEILELPSALQDPAGFMRNTGHNTALALMRERLLSKIK
jgi:hypothetical protein